MVSAISCNNHEAENKGTPTSGIGSNSGIAANEETEGGLLIKKNDCGTCHKADVKLVGPAFKDIAAKYPSTPENIAMLSSKVMKGGSGIWGDVPMAAHPTLAQSDAEKMVTFILSQK